MIFKSSIAVLSLNRALGLIPVGKYPSSKCYQSLSCHKSMFSVSLKNNSDNNSNTNDIQHVCNNIQKTADHVRMWAVVETYYKHAEYSLTFIKTEKEMNDFLFAQLIDYKYYDRGGSYEGVYELDLEDLMDLVVELGNERVRRDRGWGVREITEVPIE